MTESPFPSHDAGEREPAAPLTRAQLARGLLRALVLVYLAFGAALTLGQAYLLFPGLWLFDGDEKRTTGRLRYADAAGVEEVVLEREDGSSLLVWARRDHGDRVVLYLHGNGETVLDSIPLGRRLSELGWDLVAMEYAGYPGCEGWPNEAVLAADARRTWDWLTTQAGYAPSAVVVHGRSIGGGIAGTLIGEVSPAGWVFESTFDSLAAVAWAKYPIYPVRWLLRTHLDTALRASEVGAPVLQVHSHDDTIVPYARAQALHDALPTESELLSLRGKGHNEPVLLVDPLAMTRHAAFLERVSPR